MKVDKADITIPKMKPFEVSIGQEYYKREKSVTGVFKVTQIEASDNATYISVMNENGDETTYGSKVFGALFRSRKGKENE